MVERKSLFDFLPHLILLVGIMIVAFPVYIAFVASTWDASTIANGQMPLRPGPHFLENYYRTIFVGTASSTRAPVGGMMLNSLAMALIIAIGKIMISIISAFAVVYFRFPFRKTAFWVIFMTLMLPVEVRIYPTYKIVADLGLLDTYAGVVLAHTVGGIPPVFVTVSAALAAFDPRLEQAARSMGAGTGMVLRRVLFPAALPGMASGAVFAFIASWDEVVVLLFITSRHVYLLPRAIWDGINENVDPVIAAVATLMILVTVTGLLIVQWLAWRAGRN